MSDRPAIRKHEEIHGVSYGVPDELMPAFVAEVVQTRQGTNDGQALAWFGVLANGQGIGRWLQHPPPVAQREWAQRLVRLLRTQLAAATGGAWLVALCDWNEATSAYDNAMLLWKDRDGDIPFTVEIDLGRMATDPRQPNHLEVAFKAWVRYAEQLLEAGITAEHTSRFALGERSPADTQH
jgi:hypothetical protein